MTSVVRVVVFGNGFATRAQLPALQWAGGADVVGIAGADLGKARATAERFGIAHATDDWRTLLELDPDLVLVTTPVDLHRPMVLEALARTRAAVLCEKPFAMDADEAREMTDAARGRGAWVDHELRWNPYRRALRRALADGVLGEPLHAELRMELGSAAFFARPFGWWFDAARGGGVLGALGSHAIDLVRHELGDVDAVCAHLETIVSQRPDADGAMRRTSADELAWLWLRLRGGALVRVTTSVASPHGAGTSWTITGTRGVARLTGEFDLRIGPHDGALEPLALPADADPVPHDAIPTNNPFDAVLPLFLRDVVRAVAASETTLPDAATFEDGRRTQLVIDAARRSSSDGGWASCAPE